MAPGAADPRTAERRSPESLARHLILLFDERFGGPRSGKFRISRKFLRQLAGRRKLSEEFFSAVAEEIFEAGFVFVDCDSYFIMLSQKQFASYRRVTTVAMNRVLFYEKANNGPNTARRKKGGQADIRKRTEKSVQGIRTVR